MTLPPSHGNCHTLNLYVDESHALKMYLIDNLAINGTRQVTRATHVRNRVCPRVELILKIIIILLIIFLGFINPYSAGVP